MLLPWKLLYLLRLPLTEKIALGGVFCVGMVCVVMAIVRTVQVGLESRGDTTPSSTWLVFWGLIETAIGESTFLFCYLTFAYIPYIVSEFLLTIMPPSAVVVGTLPAFAIFFRRRQTSRRYASYPNGMDSGRTPSRGIPLSDRSASDRPLYNSSQKMKLNSINVTRTLEVSMGPHLYPSSDTP